MTQKKPNLSLGIAYVFAAVIMRLLSAIAVVAVSALIFIGIFIGWLIFQTSKFDDQKLILQDYEELRAISKNENARPDGKKLPLIEGLLTLDFWRRDYDGNIPSELTEEKTLVVSNRIITPDGGSIGLFDLSKKSANALSEHLNKRFSKDENGVDINRENEHALCLNNGFFLDGWSINSEKKDDFFQFCAQAKDIEKIEWELIMSEGVTYINITQYVGTTYFTVTHGMS